MRLRRRPRTPGSHRRQRGRTASRLLPPLAAALAAVGACRAEPTAPARPVAANDPPATVTRAPLPGRLVAIGDLHGDLEAARASLRLAGAIDESDRWVGGTLVVVQTGDQLDRGADEQAVVDLFDRLSTEAAAAGGAVHALLGNHEVFNVAGDFEYVSPAGLTDFEDVAGLRRDDPRLDGFPPAARARAAAFLPGGPYALRLARRPAALLVGDTLLVHGGVLPEHLTYGLTRLDAELAAWMSGRAPDFPAWVATREGPLGTRRYSAQPDEAGCRTAVQVLDAIGARRMVVGHTIQERGVTRACEGALWMIDVGLATRTTGEVEVLEIDGREARALARPW